MSRRNSHGRENSRAGAHRMHRAVMEAFESRTLLAASGYTNRGVISIIVDETLAPSLTAKLDVLQQDLIGDSFTVRPIHMNAPRMLDDRYVYDNTVRPPVPINNDNFDFKADYINALAAVKTMIASDFAGLPASTPKEILLIGHVVTPYSGFTAYDNLSTHGARAMPTDTYFADFQASPVTWGDAYYNLGKM